MSVLRDAYGFASGALGSLASAEKVNAPFTATSSVEQAKHTTAATRGDVLKARNGLSFQARAGAWGWLGEAASLQAASPQSFSQLAACFDRVPEDTLFAIEDDCRTMHSNFHQHPLFATTRGVDTLSRMLMAFAQRTPEGGYIKGHTGRIAALVLVVHGCRDVEAAFWCFCALMERRLYNHCGGQVVCGALVEQRVLERLVAKKLPQVAYHLAKLGLPLATLTYGWFTSCFVSVLPAETAVRVLDSVMAEGSKVLLRVALALLKRYETAIVSCSRSDCLRKVIEARTARTTDADELLQVAFKGVGSLPGSLLKVHREVELRGVVAELADAKERFETYSLARGVSVSPSTTRSYRSLSSSSRSE